MELTIKKLRENRKLLEKKPVTFDPYPTLKNPHLDLKAFDNANKGVSIG